MNHQLRIGESSIKDLKGRTALVAEASGAASAGNWTGLPGGSHKGPFGPKIAGRTRALNSSSVRYRSAPLEQAVASWSSADRSSGRSGTGGSAVAQRLTATCAAA